MAQHARERSRSICRRHDRAAIPRDALRVEGAGLSKSFGGVRALDNASFAAAAGEVHALVGENGAGKSTMIKLLGGRLLPDTGTIRLQGR